MTSCAYSISCNYVLLSYGKLKFILPFLQAESFIMKIEYYNEKLESEKRTGNATFSDPHIIKDYKMRLMVYLNGDGARKETHMSVFLQLMKGQNDDAIQRPFGKPITFSLIHQDDRDKCYERHAKDYLEYDEAMEIMQKPSSDNNRAWGYPDVIALDELQDNGYIKNNALFLRCEIAQ